MRFYAKLCKPPSSSTRSDVALSDWPLLYGSLFVMVMRMDASVICVSVLQCVTTCCMQWENPWTGMVYTHNNKGQCQIRWAWFIEWE